MLKNKFKLFLIAIISTLSIFITNTQKVEAKVIYHKEVHYNNVLTGSHNKNNTSYNSGEIGKCLLEPEKGWNRYDDSNSKITYDGDGIWQQLNTGLDSRWGYMGTQTYSQDAGQKIKFTIQGKKIRLIEQCDFKDRSTYYNDHQIYADGKLIGSATGQRQTVNSDRTKVLTFEYEFSSYGKHNITIVHTIDSMTGNKNISYSNTVGIDAIDTDGVLIDTNSGSNSSNKKEPKMWVESPINSASIHDEYINIAGWALNDSGINHINIYLDDKYIDQTTVKYPRTDVTNTFKNYKNSVNAGFSYRYSINKLSRGSHKVRFTVVGNDGSEQSQERYFNINRKEPKLWIELPNNSQKVKNKIEFAGWTLNDSGVDYLNLYIDGKFVGKTTARYERYDIVNTFKDYIDGIHSGFSYTTDISNLSNGSHILKVISVGRDGSNISQEKKFIIDRKEPKMWIETPNNDQKVSNKLSIGGWALNDSGIKTINVYLDNTYMGSTTPKYDRTDIVNAFPSYSNTLRSGFTYNLNLSNYANGKHNLKIIVLGNDGSEQMQTRTIYK